MDERDNKIQGIKNKSFWLTLLVIAVVMISIFLCLKIVWQQAHEAYNRMECGTSLRQIGNEMRIYSNENKGRYPTADKWCDLIVKYFGERPGRFFCPYVCPYEIKENALML